MSQINISSIEEEIAELRQKTEESKKIAELNAVELLRAEDKLQLVKNLRTFEEGATRIRLLLEKNSTSTITIKPNLVLPRLLPDHTDVDPAFARDHLEAQTEQIISIFKKISTPSRPVIKSKNLKNYIFENYEIVNPDYWMARSSPKEPQRWWKAVYDKAIERLDLSLGLISRGVRDGNKGVYALKQYLDMHKMNYPSLFDEAAR